jgi:4-hydroxybenzoate polyprenyltransferase
VISKIILFLVLAALTIAVYSLGISTNPIITLVPFLVLGIYQCIEKRTGTR